jgi:hypothetical protein
VERGRFCCSRGNRIEAIADLCFFLPPITHVCRLRFTRSPFLPLPDSLPLSTRPLLLPLPGHSIPALAHIPFAFSCSIRQSPKKVGEDIAKATGDWKGLRVTVQLTIQNRQAAVSVVPSASSLVIKALKGGSLSITSSTVPVPSYHRDGHSSILILRIAWISFRAAKHYSRVLGPHRLFR